MCPDRALASLTYRRDWRNVMRFFGFVWDQSHSIREMNITISGHQGYCRAVTNNSVSRYLRDILLNLRGVWVIPEVSIMNNVISDGDFVDEACTTRVLEQTSQALKRRRPSYPFLNSVFNRGFLTSERKSLFSPAFVRWFLLSEQPFLTKSTQLRWFRRVPDVEALEKLWTELGWKGLSLYGLVGDWEEQGFMDRTGHYQDLYIRD